MSSQLTVPFRLTMVFCSLLVTGVARCQMAPDVRISNGRPAGGSYVANPVIAASGDAVYVAWGDSRSSPSVAVPGVYFNRSLDAGATWLPADIGISGAVAYDNQALGEEDIQIAAEGDLVCVAWTGLTVPATAWLARSVDGGVTWLSPTPMPTTSWRPRLVVTGGSIVVTWITSASTTSLVFDLMCTRSTDNGATWSTPVALNNVPESAIDEVSLAADGQLVSVAWLAWPASGASIVRAYCNASSDGGATWLPSAQWVSASVPPTAYIGRLSATVSGTYCYVAWSDNRFSWLKSDHWLVRSQDAGVTWPFAPTRINSPVPTSFGVDDARPLLAADGMHVAVVWGETRTPTGSDLFFRGSGDAGATWLGPEVRVNTGQSVGSNPCASCFFTQMSRRHDDITVVWAEAYPSGAFVKENRSSDAGATWQLPANLQLNQPGAVGSAGVVECVLAASAAGVFTAWVDFRNGGSTDVYFNFARGAQPVGVGTAGSGGFVPRHLTSGIVGISETFSLTFTGCLGGSLGVAAIGLGPASSVTIPFANGQLLVLPQVTRVLVMSGAPGVPGAGTASVPIVVPASTVLLGVNLNSQGVFLDPVVPGGLTLSNGIRSWIG